MKVGAAQNERETEVTEESEGQGTEVGGAGRWPVLVVDDSRSSQALLAGLLRRWGHHVLTASDGEEAWRLLEEHPVGLVITDWVMPGLSGPELCRRIRASKDGGYTYTIVLTAKQDREERVEALDAGADDFLSKPFDPEELRVRMRAGERVLALERRLASRNRLLVRSHARVSRAHQRLEKDVMAAGRVQRGLLPAASGSVHGWRFDSLFLPSNHVSGDLFNYYSLDETRLCFYHFDVAGHGVPAALMSAALSHELAPQLSLGGLVKAGCADAPGYRITPPAELIAELNGRHQDAVDGAGYFTMLYGVLDCENGACELSQAGHPNPIHLRRGLEPRLLGGSGFPVGLLPEATYDSFQLDLLPGDRLVLHSDGVTDCRSPAGEVFGLGRLLDSLDATREESLAGVMKEVERRLRAWRGRETFDDDLSLLAIEAPESPGKE